MVDTFFSNIQEDGVYKFFSGGKWIKSYTGNTIDVVSPIDDSVVGKIQAVATDEIDEMIASAYQAHLKWSNFLPEDRSAILKKAADLISQNLDELTNTMVLEIGKTKNKARSDIARAADIVNYTADQLDWVSGEEVMDDKDFPGSKGGKTAHIIRQPLGVVLGITPFNYPINLAVTKIAPALLVGNSIIIKGATQGSVCSAMLVEIFNKAGVPSGVISFVSGKGSEIGDYLVTHEGIGMINFTGGTEVGKSIIKKSLGKPLLLELGGKDAALVLDDADLDLASEEIVKGAFGYSGQRCTAIKRVLAHKDIYDTLGEKIAKITKEDFSITGDPREEKTQIGPLISKKQAQYVKELIEDATANGAKILAGDEMRGNYIDAMVIDGVTEDMRLAWEEQFGPVLPIIKCEDENEMIDLHNRSQYGLGASIFSMDESKARKIAEKLEAGVIQINAKSERFPDSFPFFGVKDSGVGIQGIRWSIEAMSQMKSIVVNKSG